MKFHAEDHGFCRVYYRGQSGALYCYQDDGRAGVPDFKFYACSRDGEPSHEVYLRRTVLPKPPGQTGTGRDLIAWMDANPVSP